MNQPALFDASKVSPTPCPVPHCGAIRLAGQTTRLITCAHDLEPQQRRRPRQCLNAWDPTADPFPEGY